MIVWTPAKKTCFHYGMDIGCGPYTHPVDYTEEEERQATVNLFAGLLENDEETA